MEARILRALLLSCAALISTGANYRTQNFIVSAPTPQLAAEIGQSAERFRSQLAVEWLGRELPPWPQACPIEAQVAPHLGAGGATSFVFIQGQPRDWTMSVQGSRERVLDSVLPHEVTHTIFATHFGRPLPRWADEGACTTVEHTSEKRKQEQNLIVFLKSSRGIAFNKMFAMKEYPKDILPLYSQGFSLARYLIQQGGKRKYVDYVGEGMQTNDWNGVTRKYYGFEDLSELQVTWLGWVKQGSPAETTPLSPDSGTGETQVASSTPIPTTIPAREARLNPNTTPNSPYAAPRPAAVRTVSSEGPPKPTTTGWYGKGKQDSATGGAPNVENGTESSIASSNTASSRWNRSAPDSPIALPPGVASGGAANADVAVPRPLPVNDIPPEPRDPVSSQAVSRPQNPESPRQVILEWSRHPSDKTRR